MRTAQAPSTSGDSSGPLLGPLGMGGANLGNLFTAMDELTATAVLDAAWDGGIRHFDTAPHYGLGLSERRMGRFLRSRPRDEYIVSTKVGRLLRPSPGSAHHLDEENSFLVPADHERVWDVTEAGIRRSLEESLGRLGLDRVDIVYLHDPEETGDLDEALRTAVPALVRLREEGLVRLVGLGSKSSAALLAGARSGALDLVMAAGRLTLLERADGLVETCRRTGTGIVVAGVFNSGLLAAPWPDATARYEYAEATGERLDHARDLARRCAGSGVDLPTAALHYPLTLDPVHAVVIGADGPGQVRQNLARIGSAVPADLWERLALDPSGARR